VRLPVSVVMCTYNGSLYVEKQLNTILKQLNKNDEIIIIDDNSTDNTYDILKSFAKNFDNIKLYKNKYNIGFLKNFQKALSLVSHEIILLSDQDDLWVDNKVNTIIDIFNKHPDIEVIFTDAYLINDIGIRKPYSLWEKLKFNNLENTNIFSILLKNNIATGATMALKRNFLMQVIDIPDCWVHDGWFAIVASSKNTLFPLNCKLIEYRQHNNNVIGVGKENVFIKMKKYLNDPMLLKKNIDEKICRYVALKNFIEKKGIKISQKKINDLNDCINFWSLRKKFFQNNLYESLKIIIKFVLKGYYNKYSTGINSILKDLFILIKRKNLK
jgi:glycosyltransferase involved in cell wall biosynthesis